MPDDQAGTGTESVTISDGCDGILYIGADSENTVTIDTTVTDSEGGVDYDGRKVGI